MIMQSSKMIVIKSNFPIGALGGVYGPITQAYREDSSRIFQMLSEGHEVYEVGEDGQETKLELATFDYTTYTPTEETEEVKVEEVPEEPKNKFQTIKENNKGKDKNKGNKQGTDTTSQEVPNKEEKKEESDDVLLTQK